MEDFHNILRKNGLKHEKKNHKIFNENIDPLSSGHLILRDIQGLKSKTAS